MALLTIDPAENHPMLPYLRGSASMAHRAGYSPPPRHHQRIMTAPAITRPRKTGTIIGGTNQSRSLNVWMVDILTALVVAGVHISQSPIAAKGGR
jgi:hypothetical protein